MITTKTLLAVILTTALGCAGIRSARAAIIVINPSKDNTLYEYDPAEGDHSNGAGFHFFAGENGMGELRRGVLAFDIAGTLPAGSTITAVSLTMNMSMTPLVREPSSCTSCLPIGAKEPPTRPWGKVTERRLRLMMPHGDTVFSTRLLDNAGRRFFGHRDCKPVGWRYRAVHVDFSADGCGCAIVVRQPGQQLRLAGVRR